jgi:predicted MFS family arabinose efflux permease
VPIRTPPRREAPALVAGWLVFTVANAQRIAVVPFFNDLRRIFHIDYASAGGLLSAYLVGYVLGQVPAGLAADNLPARRVTVAGLATITAASALFALSGRYWPAMALRAVMGMSAAGLYSSTVKLVLGAARNRGAAMGVLQSGAGTGTAAGLFVMPLLAASAGLRAAFVGLAAASCLVLFYAALRLPPGAAPRTAAEPARAQLAQILRRPAFVYLSGSVFLALFGAYGITAWLPTYLRNEFKLSSVAAGGVAALINVALVIASPFAGSLSDRVGSRAAVVLAGFGVLAGAFSLLLVVHGPWGWVAVSAALAGVGLAMTLPILTTLTTEVFGIGRAGLAVSLNLACGQVASTISGVLLGYILDRTGGFASVWMVGLAVVAGGALPALGLRRVEAAGEPPAGG